MKRALELELSSHIPARVLPVSTKPPGDFDFLIDREFKLVAELLKPGNRRRDEARGRIRALLAMEGLVAEEVQVSEKDINRIEKAVKAGTGLNEVFPRLNTIASTIEGEGPAITVRFSKKEGPAVRYVAGDDPAGAAAVREVDLQKKFYMGATELANTLRLSGPRSVALRRYLQIDDDPSCRRTFEFGKAKHDRFSDNARTKMKAAMDRGVDMEVVWRDYRPGRRPAPVAEN